ncbi:MAG: hypothetical protein N2484_07130 [Clostridia bacterium]|nr:hypothetical protein [Clostridia bacterium]
MKNLLSKDKTKRIKSRIVHLSFERVLFLLFIATFTLLVIVQAAMTNPTVRTFLTADNEMAGTPLGVEEFLYEEGSISLKLVSEESDPDLRVLINGDEVAAFNENIVNISVKDGDVVEIDGSSSFKEAKVEIVSKSENIATDCIGKMVNIRSNIKKVTDIRVETQADQNKN